MNAILENLKTTQILRISCSDIAAVTGFHPWAKLDELFEKYLYQDLDELMMQDAENLDTEFLTTEQEVQKILQKIDTKEKAALVALDSVTKDETVLNNNTKAEDMLKQIQELMKSSGVLNKISSTELKFVENEFRGRVRKNYGINCENKSLDKYEEVVGFPVVERNLDIIKLKVMPEEDSGGGKASSASIASKGRVDTLQQEGEEESPVVDAFSILLDGSKRLSREQALGVKKRRVTQKPSFVQIGRVDGVSYQPDLRSEDPTQWSKTQRVVVEMKSRVRGITTPPPLYEQIQLVSYMIILDCDCGDLVQAVARAPEEVASRNPSNPAATSSSSIVTSSSSVCCVVETEGMAMGGAREEGGLPISATVTCSSASSTSSTMVVTESTQVAEDAIRTTEITVEESSSQLDVTDFLATTHSAKRSNCISEIVETVAAQVPRAPAPPAVPPATAPVPPPQLPQGISNVTSSAAQTGKGRWRRFDPSELYSEEHFHVSRIQLDGPPFYHRKYWDTVVMPRLRQFRDAVAVMRGDDSLRYAYLMSPPEAKMQMLQNLCPYFEV